MFGVERCGVVVELADYSHSGEYCLFAITRHRNLAKQMQSGHDSKVRRHRFVVTKTQVGNARPQISEYFREEEYSKYRLEYRPVRASLIFEYLTKYRVEYFANISNYRAVARGPTYAHASSQSLDTATSQSKCNPAMIQRCDDTDLW